MIEKNYNLISIQIRYKLGMGKLYKREKGIRNVKWKTKNTKKNV